MRVVRVNREEFQLTHFLKFGCYGSKYDQKYL
jgi:hypothetical protein